MDFLNVNDGGTATRIEQRPVTENEAYTKEVAKEDAVYNQYAEVAKPQKWTPSSWCRAAIKNNIMCKALNFAAFLAFIWIVITCTLNVSWPEYWHEAAISSMYVYDIFVMAMLFSFTAEHSHKED